MKVATAGICCLLLVISVVNGAMFKVPPVINEVDGRMVIQCSVEWEGEYTQTIDQGQTIYLSTARNRDCFECGPCDDTGMECRQLFRACPQMEEFN